MPKLAAPSFNGVSIPPDLRRALEASLRPAAAALNKALVVGDSLQVWGPLLVTGTGAGGAYDASGRLVLPTGLKFPDSTTLDTAAGGGGGGAATSPRPDAHHLFFLDFDEAAGATTVVDKTSNGNDFTVSSIGAGVFGATVPIPGYDRTGLMLKGETGLYNIHLASGPEPAYPVSLEFAYVPIGPSPGTWSMLINKNYRPTTWVTPWVALNLQKENTTDGSYSTGITTGSASNLKVTTPTWAKIAHTAQSLVYIGLTYDGTTFSSYVNGRLFNATARTGAIDYGTHGDWSVGSEGVNSSEAFPVQGVMLRAALSNISRPASYFQSVYKSLMGQA